MNNSYPTWVARHSPQLPKIEPTENCQLGNITDFLANSDKYNVILLKPAGLVDKDSCNNNTTQRPSKD